MTTQAITLPHAWKVHACLPVKSLLKNGSPISPYAYLFGVKSRLRRFRVLFCPCIVNIDQRHDVTEGKQLDRKNNPECGIRGIHVGLPHNSASWLLYIPSTSQVLVSADVAFDKDFLSTVSHTM